ncbi:MAG: DNA repair protein RadA [Oscillospiraceae bacterium]
MKAKTVFYCAECGNEYPKWMGQCPACGSWNTLVEQTVQKTEKKVTQGAGINLRKSPVTLKELDATEEIRFSTGLGELDRVLGGGAVKGSLVLVGGAPGIGKSTLLLQICQYIGANFKILYVTGEESERQLKMRAQRLAVDSDNLLVLSETNMGDILDAVEAVKPDILIADSIQTLYSPELTSAPGSVGQVKDCTLSLMQIAKSFGVTVFVIGHVNKEGAIAGPKVLEHMVDCVLYFEGEQSASYRVLRAAKNRFGSTNEIGVFEMLENGLSEVPNPSEMLLSGRPENTPGTCVSCIMEGSRPVLAEIQALLTPTSFNVPRRTSNGVDYNRAMLLLAVLEKRGRLRIGGCDAYINVIGGLYINEPAADLAAVLAIASSFKDIPISDDLVALGEVGLTGELRTVSQIDQRLSEIARHGFNKCIIPKQRRGNLAIPAGLKVFEVKNIREAMDLLLAN